MNRLFACIAVMTVALVGAAQAQPDPSPVQPAPVKRTMLGKVEVPGANHDVITAPAATRIPAPHRGRFWKASSGLPSTGSRKRWPKPANFWKSGTPRFTTRARPERAP